MRKNKNLQAQINELEVALGDKRDEVTQLREENARLRQRLAAAHTQLEGRPVFAER